MTSLPSRWGFSDLPAPEVPVAATTTTSVGWTSPAASAGARPEHDGGGIAAGHGDAGSTGELLALAGQLGQPVGPGALVRGFVELLPGLGGLQPVVGRSVDDHYVIPQLRSQLTGGAVGQGEEDHVVTGQCVSGGVGEDSVRQRVQVRLELAEALAGVGVAGDGTDLHVRVVGQKAQDFSPA